MDTETGEVYSCEGTWKIDKNSSGWAVLLLGKRNAQRFIDEVLHLGNNIKPTKYVLRPR